MNNTNRDKLVRVKNRIKKLAQDHTVEIAAFTVSFLVTVAVAKATRPKSVQSVKTVRTGDISSIRTGSQSVYAFFGSPLQLILDDGIAEGHNRFMKEFIDAQMRYKDKCGKQWDASKALPMIVDDKDQKAYNVIAKLMNYIIDLNGGSLELPEAQCTSDYLEKLPDLSK
jgi:hypothetical protein